MVGMSVLLHGAGKWRLAVRVVGVFVLLGRVEQRRHAILRSAKAFATQSQNSGIGGPILEVVAMDLVQIVSAQGRWQCAHVWGITLKIVLPTEFVTTSLFKVRLVEVGAL